MKKIYESPVMMVEIYKTNAYCSSCGTSFKDGTLTTDASHAKSSNDGGYNWKPGDSRFGPDDLKHTFKNGEIFEYSEGLCGGGRGCDNKDQAIWKCTCHPDSPWYLEWSHYYSIHENGADTFFLYHEEYDSDHFNITRSSREWPAIEYHSDYNVAQIVYTENESIVANS